MTSPNIELHDDPTQIPVAAPADSIVAPTISHDSPSADSNFSDAYKEQENGPEGNKDETVNQDSETSDDYAMTFDSDGDENSDSQDISQANLEQETNSLPLPVPASDLPSSTISHGPQITEPSLTGQQNQPTRISPHPTHPTTADTTAASHSDTIAAQTPIEMAIPQIHAYEDAANGGIDIQQLLDNITANSESHAPVSTLATPSPASASNSSLPKATSGLPAHASLPPRPQIMSQPPSRSNHPFHDDIPKYRAGTAGLPPQLNAYRPPGVTAPLIAAGAPGTSSDPRSGLPPPPTASFRPPPPLSAASPIDPVPYAQVQRLSSQDHLAKSIESPDGVDDADQPWGPAVQKLYDEFLSDERMYVTEGLWDRFPLGSRLFIGNLPTEKVTKRDLFHVFHKYGRLAQVSIKQAYGFVQFHDSAACYTALDREQGQEVRGRKMHLEISKPQKNTRNAQNTVAAPVRRSRSPDYARGGTSDRGGRQPGARSFGVDRYEARSVPSPREGEYGRPLRVRDDYRPGRSPSPPRGSYRGRDDYGHSHGRDGYDSRDRRRSRSRSPYGHRDSGRYRERSQSPRARETTEDADLQIPRRKPRDVPDVQIILMGELDRGFVSWVEGELRGRGIKSEVMFLSPRLPLEAVIRRQILEGVHAVSQLDMRSQNSSKIPLQVFDRQGGENNVRFDEYQDLEPKIAAELVLRAKQSQAPMTNSYNQPQFSSGQSYQTPIPNPAANIANLVGQLDNATLQKLLSTLNAPQQQQVPQNAPPAASATSSLDLAGLLGGLKQQQPQQGYQTQSSAADPYASLAANPVLASLLGNGTAAQHAQAQVQPQPQQSAQQVQNIMAQLARFRQ